MEGIGKLMSMVGPIVKAVELAPNGTMKEITLDMTPAENAIAKLLGGVAGLIGALPSVNVVGVALREGILEQEDSDADDKPSKLAATAGKAKASAAASKTLARLAAAKGTRNHCEVAYVC